jgi:Zn-finger nucleic acid-binding protein
VWNSVASREAVAVPIVRGFESLKREGGSMRNCPACRAELAQATFGGVTVDGCAHCGGVWFDRDELTRIARGDLSQLGAIDRAFEGAPTDAAHSYGPCPVCDQALIAFEPPQARGLQLVGCSARHGIWLRERDFEVVIERVEQWRAQRADAATPTRAAPAARERLREVARAFLTHECPRCRQPNANASAVCWACGAVLTQTETLFSCPRCFDPMDHLSHEGVTLNQCRVCASLWLDSGELGALIDLPREALESLTKAAPAPRTASGATPRALPCPVCTGELREHEYAVGSGVPIHTCGVCKGLWVSPEALLPIQDFVRANENYLPSAADDGS